jgi:hypothetical protein
MMLNWLQAFKKTCRPARSRLGKRLLPGFDY